MLRGLLAASPSALVAVDDDGKILYVSDQAERLFQWQRSDLVGQSVEVLVPPRFLERHRAGFARRRAILPHGDPLDLWARRKDGSEFPAQISLSSFPTASGLLYAAAIRDVTLARSTEHRLRAVLSSAPDAILGVNAEGKIELANEQAERLFGWAADELVGQQVEVLVPEDVVSKHAGHRASYVSDPRTRPMGAGLQLSGRRKDGSKFPAEISLSSVVDDRGALLVLAAVRDITERLELEAERQRQVAEAQRERSHRLESLGQLAGGVAHDFNNLLGVIMNYSRLLTRHLDDPTMLADLEEIRAAADRGSSLTKQLLTFARRDMAKPESLEITEVVRGVASMLDRTLGDHITLDLQLAEQPLVATADRHHVEQIVLNLALNSRDAMPRGGVLTISTSEEPSPSTTGTDAVISVQDSGVGMSPDVVAHAFEPFFTTKARGQGTGLGLATVYGIVRQNGGDVTIDSVVDGGTTVTVRLPTTSTAPRRMETSPATSSGGSERILLVEDEEPLRRGTARLLEEYGYEVTVASDGVEALETFENEGPFDLLVSDIAMPRMRGDELAEELRRRGRRIPVVFMSGYDSGSNVLMEHWLAKPVDEHELARAVREALDG